MLILLQTSQKVHQQTILGGVVSGTFLVYSEVVAQSAHLLGGLLFFQLICMVCGCELAAKTLVLSATSMLT